jgi:non-lysosomal glucosylceramidase
LLDHTGADQTYDTWLMIGASAYTGGLLLAALEAAQAMAHIQGDAAREQEYANWLSQAQSSFEAKLWNGRYYRFNTANRATRESIMADQLAGQWYAGATGLPDIAPKAHIDSALQMIYEYNVRQFADGQMGAVNGMRPNGIIDTTSDQSQEVWSGVSYALSALMLQEGMTDQAWHTAWGVYHTTYETSGFWFRTPEAWTKAGTFRASMYMRPQSIWAIEHALRQR